MKNSFIRLLINEARRNKNVVLLTADLGNSCLEPFVKEFPGRFFNVGVSEQNMVGIASGLAMQGKKVFIYSIGNFCSLRCLEQLRNSICLYNLDVTIIAVGAGIEYGFLGNSHYCIEDISAVRVLPNISVFNPATINELEAIEKHIFVDKCPKYLRLSKNYADIQKDIYNLDPYEVKKGQNVLILSSGTIISEVLKANELLKNENINISIYSCPCVKPINSVKLRQIVKDYEFVFTVEEHSGIGGFGSAIAEIISKFESRPILNIIGLDNRLFEAVGNYDYLKKQYKIDHQSIYFIIKQEIKNKGKKNDNKKCEIFEV